jgi:hypothetical protein
MSPPLPRSNSRRRRNATETVAAAGAQASSPDAKSKPRRRRRRGKTRKPRAATKWEDLLKSCDDSFVQELAVGTPLKVFTSVSARRSAAEQLSLSAGSSAAEDMLSLSAGSSFVFSLSSSSPLKGSPLRPQPRSRKKRKIDSPLEEFGGDSHAILDGRDESVEVEEEVGAEGEREREPEEGEDAGRRSESGNVRPARDALSTLANAAANASPAPRRVSAKSAYLAFIKRSLAERENTGGADTVGKEEAGERRRRRRDHRHCQENTALDTSISKIKMLAGVAN